MSTIAPPREAYVLRETEVSSIQEALVTAEDAGLDLPGIPPTTRLVKLHLIRPCVGRGKGRHLYEAEMLRENAGIFRGWKMYVDHDSAEARRARRGLPRGVREIGGRIVESYWDDSVPASGRFGQGAVVGWAIPAPDITRLVENDPGLLGVSINATATGIRERQAGGEAVYEVTGIAPRGSVDWVSEAGAGGAIAALTEGLADELAEADLSSLSDEDFVERLEEARPDLADLLALAEDDEYEAIITKLQKRGVSRKLAEKMAKNALRKKHQGGPPPDSGGNVTEGLEEDEDMRITPELLREALADEETREVLREAFGGGFDPEDLDSLIEARVAERVQEVLPSALEEEREVIRAQAELRADRRVRLYGMQATADRLIRESHLPPKWQSRLKAQFVIQESGDPTDDLDVIDDVDDDGDVTETAEKKLEKKVKEAIAEARGLIGESDDTRVRGQGPKVRADRAAKPGDDEDEAKKDPEKAAALAEADMEENMPLVSQMLRGHKLRLTEADDLWASVR